MRSEPELAALRREQEFYLLGLVHCGLHEIDELYTRWSAVYPAHRHGGRTNFDCLVRELVGKGKVTAQLEDDRVLKLFPPSA